MDLVELNADFYWVVGIFNSIVDSFFYAQKLGASLHII